MVSLAIKLIQQLSTAEGTYSPLLPMIFFEQAQLGWENPSIFKAIFVPTFGNSEECITPSNIWRFGNKLCAYIKSWRSFSRLKIHRRKTSIIAQLHFDWVCICIYDLFSLWCEVKESRFFFKTVMNEYERIMSSIFVVMCFSNQLSLIWLCDEDSMAKLENIRERPTIQVGLAGYS